MTLKTSLDKEIIICTTFRDFNGSKNDLIQKKFVRSLKKQTYSNWRLVVTVFSEKNVEKELKKEKIDVIYHKKPIKKHRFSFSEVLKNGIKHLKKNKSIILWTTCDVILANNFLQEIINNYSPRFSGTSHPHKLYKNIIKKARLHGPRKIKLDSGIDLMFFDGDLFLGKHSIQSIIGDYPNLDWGLYEHFLAGVAKKYAKTKINLFPISKISKVENDREPNNETKQWLSNSWNNNKKIVDRFIKDNQVGYDILSLWRCHFYFKLIGRPRTKYLTSLYLPFFFSINFIKEELLLILRKLRLV
jgi:hypothetical protein